MESSFIEWLVGQAGIGGLAAMSLYLLNRAHQDALRREKEHAEQNRSDKLEFMRVLSDTARALTGLEKAIDDIVTVRKSDK